jgi:F-type H+-transporting ATPase subunit a
LVQWILLALVALVVRFPAQAHEEQAAPSHGEEAASEAVEEEEQDVAKYIFHHVSDSNDLEWEIPLNLSAKNPVIHLPLIRIPFKEGACPANPRQPASLSAGCLDLSITKHTVMMWIAAVLLLIVLSVVTPKDRRKLVPHGTWPNLFEMVVLYVRDELAIKNIGKEEGPKYTPYLLSAFFFILFMNLLGLIPWMSTATSNLAITCGLALCTFVITQAAGIRAAGLGGYLKHLTGGVHWVLWPIMIPVEVMGLFTKPFALTVRLFANMLAGHIVIFFLLGLIFLLGTAWVAPVSVAFAMGIYALELFVALIQAFVFTMLSSLFIGLAVATGYHAEHEGKPSEAVHGHAAAAAPMVSG